MGEDNRYDVYREAVAGRANVEDTPELVAYYRSLEQFEAEAREGDRSSPESEGFFAKVKEFWDGLGR